MLLYNEYFLVLGRICIELINIFVFLDVERKLDEVLRKGEFDSIKENVTAKTLTSCKTNALLKAFEVSCLSLLACCRLTRHTLQLCPLCNLCLLCTHFPLCTHYTVCAECDHYSGSQWRLVC